MRVAALAVVWLAAGCGRIGFGERDAPEVGIDGPDSDGDSGMSDRARYLKATPAGALDLFGHSVALSADGNTLAVGAYNEASASTTINGDPTDNSALGAGAVYVFARVGGVFTQQAYLKASNAGAADVLGYSLAISADGNTIVAGAPDEDGGATTINGNGNDDSKDSSGAAYVFVRTGSIWTQQAYLKAASSELGDNFGAAVAIAGDGNTVAVGAITEDGAGTGTTGDPLNNAQLDAGAVYVFTRGGVTWTQETYLKASNTDADDHFGASLALSQNGQRLAVAATGEASNAAGIDGNQANNSNIQAGAVYVFARSGPSWSQAAYVKPSNPDFGDFFGSAVALSGDGTTLAVAAEGEDSPATGIGGAQIEGAGEAGAVYVFVNGGSWTQQAYVKASNTDADDRFGRSIALSADGAVLSVGAAQEDSAETGLTGTGADNAAPNSGAVYVYQRQAASWLPMRYIKAPNTGAGDAFGSCVASSSNGQTLVIGAPSEDSGGTDPTDNTAMDAGAVYVIE